MVDAPTTADPSYDPRAWLEDVEGAAQLAWVKQHNNDAVSIIGDPTKQPMHDRVLAALESKDKIPFIGRFWGGFYYNFWTDAEHVKGIWRRCTPQEYKKTTGTKWETIFDVDQLGKDEGVSWVWEGSEPLDEGPSKPVDRVMLRLSRGGSDAIVAREFDLNAKAFVPEEQGGFRLPEAKMDVSWKDRDTLLVGGSCLGEDAVTESGYARTTREWKRGTPLASAVEVFAGLATDVSAQQYTYLDKGFRFTITIRSTDFYHTIKTAKLGPDGFGEGAASAGFRPVPIPDDAALNTFADHFSIELRSEWMGYAAGSFLVAKAEKLLALARDAPKEEFRKLLTPLFEPTERSSITTYADSLNYIILTCLDNVQVELHFWRYDKAAASSGKPGAGWTLETKLHGDNFAQLSVGGLATDQSDEITLTSYSFLEPAKYHLSNSAKPEKQELLKSKPGQFDAAGLHVEQCLATSLDGTKVPYFLVRKKDGAGAAKKAVATPTLLYGYGGFEISELPSYSATRGIGWLEKGYSFALANIRGGGEFGPPWHQAALKEKRHKSYEDFEAVARDLVLRGVTTAKQLGIMGGSNGGLLMGNMLARSPELFGAIVCQVPLLDMHRYNKLLAGASWMGEYGNPDLPEEWEFLKRSSPYHTLRDGASAPPILFTTSTRDDRVHPAHARKTHGKCIDLNLPSLSYENIEGGHGGAADNKQRAFMVTLEHTFLEKALVADGAIPAAIAAQVASNGKPRDGGTRRGAGRWSWVAAAIAVGIVSTAVVIAAKKRRN